MKFLTLIHCWWFGCEQHPQDPTPPDQASCMHCGEYVDYADMVGDTRHNRFKDFIQRFSWRRIWPVKCCDCGHRFKCDLNKDHIPF